MAAEFWDSLGAGENGFMKATAEGTEWKRPVNYVFVDYENVHDVDLSLIGTKTVYLTLLVGARQSKLNAALVEKLLAHAASVQLVRLESSGKNALDFALAYYLGKAAQSDPTAYFHIVSKDAGFDPLIDHLASRHIHVRRHSDFSTLTFSWPPKAGPILASAVAAPTPSPTAAGPEALLTRVVAHLQKNLNNRPKRKKTLVSHLLAVCGKTATATGVDDLIARLTKAGHLSIGAREEVTYHFSPN